MAISNSVDRFNGVIASLAIKAPCIAVAIANITLSGTQTVNGVAVVSGDRVLVLAQTNAVENGVYDASSSAWARAADFDGNRDIVSGTLVTVATATVGRNPFYQVTTANPITIGSTAINFTLADGANVSYALTAAEISAGLTDDDIIDSHLPGNVLRYGAVGDNSTDNWQSLTNAIAVSDQAYFSGADYTLVFPSNNGTLGRYLVSQTLVINRNGTMWRGEIGARRHRNTTIAFTASATDTTLIDLTGETSVFENLTFQGFALNDQAGILVSLTCQPRFPTASEVISLGLDAGTKYRFEDTDSAFIDCVFQWSTVGIFIEGRGLSVDTSEFQEVTVGIDLERASDYQIGENVGQGITTGLRAYAIRNNRFHGMGIGSACIRNVGTQKANFTGLIFTGNFIDTHATVMYGPMQDAYFSCVHNGIRRIVFDANTTTGLGDASGVYINVDIAGTYNCRTFRDDSLNANNFMYADGGRNISINANIRDVLKDVIRFDGAVDCFSLNGSFYDVMQDGASAWWSLVKLNGAAFTNITVAGSLQTDSGLTSSPSIVAAVGSFTLVGYNFDGLSFDLSEWVAFESSASVSPFGAADATPSMMGRKFAETGTSALTITDIDDGVTGHTKTILSKGAITFDTTGTNLTGSSVDIITASGDITEWYCEDGTTWVLKAYVDVSADNSAGA